MSGPRLTRKHLSRRVVLRGAGAAARAAAVELDAAGRARVGRDAARRVSPASTFRTAPSCASGRRRPTGRASSCRRSCGRSQPFRDRLNVVSDLTLPLAYGDDASAGANHTRSSAVWLTCAQPERGATPQLGTSIDQVVARAFGQDTPLPSLELVARGRRPERRLGPLGRLPQHDRLAHADGAVADGGESAGRVRAAVRRRRDGRAARAAARAGREPARLGARRRRQR